MQGTDPPLELQTKLASPFKDLLVGLVFCFGFNIGKAAVGISTSQAISIAVVKQPS